MMILKKLILHILGVILLVPVTVILFITLILSPKRLEYYYASLMAYTKILEKKKDET